MYYIDYPKPFGQKYLSTSLKIFLCFRLVDLECVCTGSKKYI